MTIPNLLLSVDPGADGGWVLWVDGKIKSHGVMNGNNTQGMYRLIGGLSKTTKSRPVLVIEKQYINTDKKRGNIRTGMLLIERRARWQTIAELFAWDVVFVNPRSWQSKIIKGVPGNNTKEKSMVVAQQIMNCEPPTHDVADAVCIGQYYLNQQSDLGKVDLSKPKGRKAKR